MTPDLYLAVAITVLGYLMLFVTGINGIRHARIIGLGFDGYAMSSVWLWIALSGSLNLIISLRLIILHGMPTTITFASGHQQPFAFGIRNWTMLFIGLVIVSALCVRSFIMVRNAKRMTKEARLEHAKTYAASLKLRDAIKGE